MTVPAETLYGVLVERAGMMRDLGLALDESHG